MLGTEEVKVCLVQRNLIWMKLKGVWFGGR